MTQNRARAVPSTALVAARSWEAELHPRGRDGKFIEKLGMVKLFDFVHPRSKEQISESTGVVKNIFGGDRIMVELPDGVTVPVKSNQIESLGEKARLTLYRGEGDLDNPSYYTPESGEAGGWWTSDRDAADRYAKGVPGGKVYEIEVEGSEVEPRGAHYFISDPTVRSRRRLTDSGALYQNENFLDTVKQVDAAEFHKGFAEARQGRYGAFLSDFDESHFAQENVDVYSAFDGKVGAALTRHEDGRVEIGSLYALEGAPPKAGIDLLRYLLDEKGVNWLNNFDGPLTDMYEANGFKVDTSDPWNEEYAPDGWDYERFDNPAYITMSRKMERPVRGAASGRSIDTGTTGTDSDESLRQDRSTARQGMGRVPPRVDGRAVSDDAGLRASGRSPLGADALTASVRVEAMRAFVHNPHTVLVSFTAADWNPDLHPRGHDGKFIETLGLIHLIDMAGFRHGQRGDKRVQGQVQEIIPDPDDPGNPIIRVKMTDPRWDASAFGETFDARSYQVSAREPGKATIPKEPVVDLAGELLPDEPPSVTPIATDLVPSITESDIGVGMALAPMAKPGGWDGLSPAAKQSWITDQMQADLSAFRGAPTVFNLESTDPEVAFNLANRYRELTGIDTPTALWVDGVVTNASAHLMNDELVKPTSAIAVAHPGTKHPGGIGPITNRKAIVLNQVHFQDDKTWAKEKAMSSGGSFPWSVGSTQGDYTATMVHEFGHHRQFRYLAETMLEAGQPFSKVRHADGFGLMPDSSNWPEVQAARYEIQKLAPSQYGLSKSSEAFAEVWAGVVTGYVPISPELQSAWDSWHLGMDIPGQMPPTRYTPDELVDYGSLAPEELDAYWAEASALLELPGMREHYPQTAALYDSWAAGTVYAESDFGEPIEFPSESLELEPALMQARSVQEIKATNFSEVESFIREAEKTQGGAWSFFPTFGSVDIVRAATPSQIPDDYYSPSSNRIFYKGKWQTFTPAAIIREQNRGMGSD